MNPIFEINIQLPTDNSDTLTSSISKQLKENIENGNLPADTKLPSSRKFALQFGVSRNTVLHIYDSLINEGCLYSKQGGGTYVKATRVAKPAKSPPVDYEAKLVQSWNHRDICNVLPKQSQWRFNFSVGKADTNHFPFELMRKYLAQSTHAYSKRKAFDISPKGYDRLRQVLANHLAISRTIICSADDLIMTSGAQQALDLIAKVLIKPGETKVVVEQPCYAMAETLFKAHGATVVSVAVDEEGIIIDDIPHDTDIIYVTPSHQFPLGMPMSAKRRRSLIELADQQDMLIIEDDYDSEFRLTNDPVETLYSHAKKDNIFLIGTFTKIMIPDVRAGFIITPEWASNALQAAKFITDRRQPIIRQHTLYSFIEQGHLLKHLRKMRKVYQDRYHALLTACKEHADGLITPIPVKAGIHVAANLPKRINAYHLAEKVAQHQVSILSVQHLCPHLGSQTLGTQILGNQTTKHNALVFGLGRIEAQDISEGVRNIMKHV